MTLSVLAALLGGTLLGVLVGLFLGRTLAGSASPAAAPTGPSPEQLQRQLREATAAVAAAEARLDAERQAAAEKLAALQGAREEMSNQFKALAAEILDEKSKKFTALNHQELAKILTPLQGELTGFRQKVEEYYKGDSEGRIRLEEQVRQLSALNRTLGEETTNLTRALKGDSKAQGDWGEIVLERMLEDAGLIEGVHYRRQDVQVNDEGARVIPDVVILLPQDRTLVVDSKVSLTAYSEFVSAPDDDQRAARLKAHLDSVKGHIKGLGEKRYDRLYGITSPDFVVMFLPVEGAFMTAVTSDRDLFQYAWDRSVLLVSPSTLLFVIRTVSQMWTQERRNESTQAIVDRGTKLYEKFVAFAEDLERVGEHLGKAQGSFDEARKKLTDGSGNLVRQVEMLRELGVKSNRQLPKALAEASVEEER